MKTVLKNCRVLGTTHDKDMLHDIYVENGIIEKIGLNLEVEGAKQIDVGGHTVMSGLIDMHCNICDPGHEYIEDIATASRAALRGGFTTITCEPNTDPVIDNKTVVEYIVSKSKEKSLAACLSAVRGRRLRKSGKCTMQGLSVFPMGMNLRILPHF